MTYYQKVICILSLLLPYLTCESATAYSCEREEEQKKKYVKGMFEVLEISSPYIKCEFGDDGKRLEEVKQVTGIGCIIKLRRVSTQKGVPDSILLKDIYGYGKACESQIGSRLSLTVGAECCPQKWSSNLCSDKPPKGKAIWNPRSARDVACVIDAWKIIEPKSLTIPAQTTAEGSQN
jgi:hypothetical protein